VNEIEHPAPAPPPGEELHLPGPSLLPLLCAIAITLIVVGTTISLIISIVGVVLLVILVIRWVADTRRDVSELPEQHH
jgi:Flp pilus assembly protein TadB